MGYELRRAMMEAARNSAEDAYFEARPQIDCHDRRKVFDAGFERAWDAALAQLPLRRLGERLTELLDEDQWAECEALLLAAGVVPPNASLIGSDGSAANGRSAAGDSCAAITTE